MAKVAIVTDSNSGITQKQGKELGIFVLPMPFFIDGKMFLEVLRKAGRGLGYFHIPAVAGRCNGAVGEGAQRI